MTKRMRHEQRKLLCKEEQAVEAGAHETRVHLDRVDDGAMLLAAIKAEPAKLVTFIGNVGPYQAQVRDLLASGFQVRLESIHV